MAINTTLNKVAASVPECLAAGYVDTASGMLLAIKTVDSHPREVIDLVAAATADLFNGPNVSMIERMFKKSRGLQENDPHYFQEIIVNSDNLIHMSSCAAAPPTWAWRSPRRASPCPNWRPPCSAPAHPRGWCCACSALSRSRATWV